MTTVPRTITLIAALALTACTAAQPMTAEEAGAACEQEGHAAMDAAFIECVADKTGTADDPDVQRAIDDVHAAESELDGLLGE